MLTSFYHQLAASLIDALRASALKTHPWRYANINGALPVPVAMSLAEQFDQVSLTRCEQIEGEKTYRFGTAALSESPTGLPQYWRSILQQLEGEAYRSAMSELTQIDLSASRVTLSLWEYCSGDWLSPHLDKPEKLVTQVVYLTRGWREGDGGCLLIMEGNDPASTVDKAEPHAGNSSVLVRSEASWHAVERVANGAPPRRSLTLTFWKPITD